MNPLHHLKLSMLDLILIRKNSSVAEALILARETARHVEKLGFERYWLAEHHNVPGVASSATAVMVGDIAAHTERIRVGSGGIMLPNHAPLVVAEAFGTLAELYPGRIDLGLGRAPGTDPTTMRALRRDRQELEAHFQQDVAELQRLLGPEKTGDRIVAIPGQGTEVPIWLLGSSLFSARLAAERGLPYAFASHFAPGMLLQAIDVYRRSFQPSDKLEKPYVIIGVPVIAAPTDEEAEYLATSVFQRVLGILRGNRQRLQPPVRGFLDTLSPEERHGIGDFLAAAVIGGPERVVANLTHLQKITQADEFMFVCDIYDPALRMRSLDIVAACCSS
ncbi:MAG: hypothetical protein RIQ55_883 [Pseudomonadota bacterium]|jgi:luciferase family oxidoreductase group 1